MIALGKQTSKIVDFIESAKNFEPQSVVLASDIFYSELTEYLDSLLNQNNVVKLDEGDKKGVDFVKCNVLGNAIIIIKHSDLDSDFVNLNQKFFNKQ